MYCLIWLNKYSSNHALLNMVEQDKYSINHAMHCLIWLNKYESNHALLNMVEQILKQSWTA